MTTVMTISSIRGGVGKSSLALELALHLTTKGKLLLIDTDFYSPTLFHEISSRQATELEPPKVYLRDILRGICSVDEACVQILPNLDLVFSNPKVNLWELSRDIGTKNFWSDDNTNKAAPAEKGLAALRNYTQKYSYDYLIFDTMAGLGYPVVFFSYISKHPIFLTRPSLPQIKDITGFINLIGINQRPVELVWSNVPNSRDYMKPVRENLEAIIKEKCGKKGEILGYIPRDPVFEDDSLLGNHTLKPRTEAKSLYIRHLLEIAQKLI